MSSSLSFRLGLAFRLGLGVLAISLLASPVQAETRVESLLGTVTKVDTLTSSYVVKTPRDENICEIREVPVYGENQQSDELGSMIIGGLLGSAVGNKLSDSDGAGTAGAVAGALFGRARANKQATDGDIVGYRQQEVCETRRTILEETKTRITGYRIQIEADDRILTLETTEPYNVNDRVELRKQVNYSLR